MSLALVQDLTCALMSGPLSCDNLEARKPLRGTHDPCMLGIQSMLYR